MVEIKSYEEGEIQRTTMLTPEATRTLTVFNLTTRKGNRQIVLVHQRVAFLFPK